MTDTAPTIRSLGDFQNNAGEHVQRLTDSGQPEVLTVDGRPALVVQSAAGYEALLDRLDHADAVATLRVRIAAADAGEPGVPADRVLAAVAERLRGRR